MLFTISNIILHVTTAYGKNMRDKPIFSASGRGEYNFLFSEPGHLRNLRIGVGVIQNPELMI